MTTLYDEISKEMGVQQQSGGFINLKAGSEPTIAKFIKLESAECNEKEMEPSTFGAGYAFCKPNGKTFVYTFESPVDNTIQIMRSHKDAIFWAFSNANIVPDEMIKIERKGSTKEDTRYLITRVDEKEVAAYVEKRTAEIEAGEEAMAPIEAPAAAVDEAVSEEVFDIADMPF